MNDWVPEDDSSHLIIDVVSVLDLREIYATYREDGQGAAFYFTLLADAGYWCEENAVAMRKQRLQFICFTRSEWDVFSIQGLSRALLDLEDL